MADLVRFSCSECGKRLKVGARHAGARVKCPRCQAPLVVPRAEAAPPAKARPDQVPAQPPPAPVHAGVAADDEPPVELLRGRDKGEDLDMTPMVDVTFLLLIFFMMTAAFALQKSIELPRPDRSEAAAQSRTIEEFEDDDDYLIVRIDAEDTIWVEDAQAPSRQELLSRLRELRQAAGRDGGRRRMLVLASGQSRHETVVTALDAGNAVGMQEVRLSTFDDEEF